MDNDTLITALPTMMVIYNAKLDAESVREKLRAAGYTTGDITVYHRLAGTDQVIDAATGHVAPGQGLTQGEITNKMLEHLETVVLLHPSAEQMPSVKAALTNLGPTTFFGSSDDAVKPPGDGAV